MPSRPQFRACRAFAVRGVLALLWVMPAAFGESNSSAAASTLTDLSYVVRRWGVDAGILGTRTDGIAQTADGHLWVGTRDGLFRFDGSRFTRFDLRTVPEIDHPHVRRLATDREGFLWISAGDYGIACRRQGKFYRGAATTPFGAIRCWSAHPAGGLVMSCYLQRTSTVVRVTFPDLSLHKVAVLTNLDLTSVAASPDNRLWGVGRAGHLLELHPGHASPVRQEDSPGADLFLRLSDESLAAVGRGGLYVYHQGEWDRRVEFQPSSPLAHRFSVACEDDGKRIWLGSVSGKGWILHQDGRLQELVNGRRSAPSPITGLICDRAANVWMTSFSGLYQARYSPFINREPPGTVPTPRIVEVDEDGEGTLWISCFGAICRLQPGDVEPEVVLPRPAVDVTVIAADPNGGFVFGAKSRFYARWKDGELTRILAPRDSTSGTDAPTDLLVERDGTVWLGTAYSILRCSPTNSPPQFVPLPPTAGLPNSGIGTLTVDDQHNIYASIRRHGIYLKRPGAESWTRLTPPRDRIAVSANKILVDPEGRLWAHSPGEESLGCWFDNQAWHASLAELELGHAAIVGIAADADGGLWLATTSHGVVRGDREDLVRSLQNPGHIPEWIWFDPTAGLGSLGGSFATGSILQSRTGRIHVATEAGLSTLDPGLWLAHRSRALPPQVAITQVAIDGTRRPAEESLVVPAGSIRVGIHFTTLDFGIPGENRFRYRLRGLDDAWIEDKAPEASFQKLSPGKYRFEVLAASLHDKWSPLPASLDLQVLSFWWQRTSIRTGAFLALVLAVGGYFRSRLVAMRQRAAQQAAFSRQLIDSQEAERQRLARELHDSLGPNLTIVKNRLTLEQERRSEPPEAARDLQAISDLVTQTIQEVRSISQGLRPYILDRVGLTRALLELVDGVAHATRLPIHTTLANIDGVLSPENEINLYRIVQEGLNNIVKHADAARASVEVERSVHGLRVRLEDDGRGFDTETVRQGGVLRTGMGLPGIEERVRILGGTFQCHSARRQGTVLIVTVPCPTRR